MPGRLTGVVETVIFQSVDGAFCVFRLSTPDNGMVSVVMNTMAPLLGEVVELAGQWVEHAKFGRQFKAVSYSSKVASSRQGIERFLGSGAVKGVGQAMAARIVSHFGEDTLHVLAESPQRLVEISGIGNKKAAAIAASYAELAEMRELMLFLEGHGISANYAPKLQTAYGAAAIDRIKGNPYRLAYEVDGIGFRTADRIARSMGFEHAAAERLEAGVDFALMQIGQAGHVCVPQDVLEKETARLLEVDIEETAAVLKRMLEADMLRAEEYRGQCLIYPEYLYAAEVDVAERLLHLKERARKILAADTQAILARWEEHANIRLAKVQREAIDWVLAHGVLVVTGGPGTGKTTLIKGIISVLEAAGCRILLSAPTGRAARRLAESAGRPAMTVHKMLEYVPGQGMFSFGRNEDSPLDAEAVIVDEASMLDITLADHLLKAVPAGCRLVFVGDVDQLPAVGPGNVLQDIIRSEQLPVVRLNEIFRQARESSIVLNAHAINRGRFPVIDEGGEFDFNECADEQAIAERVVGLSEDMLSGRDWQRVQVLSPMHKNAAGVQNLNKLLQGRLNPPSEGKQELLSLHQILREGDKVMQVRNNYDKEVFNGDIGWVDSIEGRTLKAYFPDVNNGQLVKYEQGELDELQLAYAMSVHKAQGSEYPVVILALSRSHYMLLQRNLLYTAVTRAKERVVIVGQKAALQTAVLNDRTRRRYSLLAERLQEEILS